MKKALTILTIILVIAEQGIACINEYRTLLSGQMVFSDEIGGLPYYRKLDSLELLRELSALESRYKEDGSVKTLSDYGVILIYLGRLDDAINLFRLIEKRRPNLYATAANMGTAFELLGANDSAYFYIQKAITINPSSHYGSEWIHLKILEAKIKLSATPDYLWNNSILSLDFGSEGKPVALRNLNLTDLEDQVRFQLSERMTFVKPPDLIVGQLLFDYGNICAITKDVEAALECYEMAEQYGYRTNLLSKRISTLKPMVFKATLANWTDNKVSRYPLIFLAVVAMIVLAGVWLTVKLGRRLSRSK